MRARRQSTKPEPTTALINVVFLILIFFMVSGSLNRPQASGIEFAKTTDLECCQTPDALIISDDGKLFFDGREVASVEAFLASDPGMTKRTIRLLPDESLPAIKLLRITADLKSDGAQHIVILTENSIS